MKENFKKILKNPIFKQIGNYVLIVLMLTIGFYSGRLSYRLEPRKEKTELNPFNDENKILTTSVAINEMNQLMVINKKSGKYQVYSYDVGKLIYKLYNNQFYNESSKK